jgi:hypothetical protein
LYWIVCAAGIIVLYLPTSYKLLIYFCGCYFLHHMVCSAPDN